MNIQIHKTAEDMAHELAVSIAGDLQMTVQQNNHATLILPGGTSPQILIGHLALQKISWQHITITTTDERDVPLNHKDSNAGQIQRIFGANGVRVQPLWLMNDNAGNLFSRRTTVTVLGMGVDGHIASIFPGLASPNGKGLFKVHAPKPPKDRISLTMETLMYTSRLILLVSDSQKLQFCQRVIDGERPDLPLARLFSLAKEKLELHAVDV